MHEQKVALVTGGNRGIGLAIVEGLARQGIKVLLACRDTDAGIKAARSLEGDIEVVELDLATTEKRQQGIAAIHSRFPHIDILVNNAGVLKKGSFSSLDHAVLMETMQTNAFSAFELTQYFANLMAKQGYGRIVNLSSRWGAFSDGILDGPAAYSISKATLNAITTVAASDYSGNIKINAMCPGWVHTQMGGAEAPRTPEQGAETALWLATLDEDGPTGGFFRDKQLIEW